MSTADVWAPFERAITSVQRGEESLAAVALPTALREGYFEAGLRNFSLNKYENVKTWIEQSLPSPKQNCVFLDTTTLTGAIKFLGAQQSWLAAFQLWDVATLINATVLFDHVVCCSNFELESARALEKLNTDLGEKVFNALPISSDANVSDAVQSLWWDARRHGSDLAEAASKTRGGKNKDMVEEAQRYSQAWIEFLNISPESFELVDPAFELEYDSQGPQLTGQILDASRLSRNAQAMTFKTQRWTEIICECNLREEFNSRLAYMLGLQYLPNSFRAPARRARYQRARALGSFLSSMRHLEKQYREQVEVYKLSSEETLMLPVLSAALFSRIDSLSEFWEALAEMRHRARKFRRHREELDQACSEGNLKEINKITEALKAESKRPGTWVTTSVGSLIGAGSVALTMFQPKLGAAAFSVQLAVAAFTPFLKNALPDGVAQLYRKVFAPQGWFLTDIGNSARALTNAIPRIERLWNGQMDDVYGTKQLERLASWGLG
jgi:hypothetical protein